MTEDTIVIDEQRERLIIEPRELEALLADIASAIEDDGWMPDVIAGISRGGLTPGVMLSHYFDVPFRALHWSTRDHTQNVSEASLAEEIADGMKVLFVDDICDSGQTLTELFADLEQCVYDSDIDLGGDVRIATVHYRKSCEFEIDYIGEFVDQEWVVYPWEAWWG